MRQSQPKQTVFFKVVLVILGLMVALGFGLLLSRAIQLPRSSMGTVASLDVNAKEEYILLVGAAYALDHDLERARAQLDRLEAPNIKQWVGNLVDRLLTEGGDEADVRALVELARGLDLSGPGLAAYLLTMSPLPTETPQPTPTFTATDAPTATSVSPAEEPTAVPPTDTSQPQPTDPPELLPTDTTVAATDTPRPQPTNTSRPMATSTPKPTNPPVAKWTSSAQLIGPGVDGQVCGGAGFKMIRVRVVDAAGNQIPGIWIYEKYTGQYRITGHKGDDPYWGPGEAEYSATDGGMVCVATGQGGSCESDYTRDLPCHDPPPFEDLWAAGYCECCEPDITQERCRELFDSGQCLGIGHYAWRVEFRRSW